MGPERIPARVEPQPVDAQKARSCEELLDFIQRSIHLTGIGKNPRTLQSGVWTVMAVLVETEQLP